MLLLCSYLLSTDGISLFIGIPSVENTVELGYVPPRERKISTSYPSLLYIEIHTNLQTWNFGFLSLIRTLWSPGVRTNEIIL